MKKDTKYLILLALLYFTVSLVGILHHELWLDESQHWLLARDSSSLVDLFQKTRNEGHPIMWNVLLFFITRFTLNPFWMQFLHIIISTTTVFVFLKKAPFNWLFKSLFIFGYFMVFEYNLISRNYMLGVLFLFLACSLYPEKEKKFVLFCLYLAIAANVHMIFSVIVLALLALRIVDFVTDKEKIKPQLLIAGSLIFGSGILILAIQYFTTDSHWFFNYLGDRDLSKKLTPGFISIFKGLLAVPNFTSIHFWETNFFTVYAKMIAAGITVLLYFLPLALFYKNKKTLFFIYTALFGIQIFFFVTQRGNIRSYGVVYIIFILALWIDSYQHTANYGMFKKRIVYSLLSLQFISGIVAYCIDFKYPFTAAENVVDYLEKNNLNTQKIATVTCDGSMISPYLERKVYSLQEKKKESYCIWKRIYRKEGYTVEKVSKMIQEYAQKNDFILVSDFPAVKSIALHPDILGKGISIRKMKSFDKSILENSAFTIYQIKQVR